MEEGPRDGAAEWGDLGLRGRGIYSALVTQGVGQWCAQALGLYSTGLKPDPLAFGKLWLSQWAWEGVS